MGSAQYKWPLSSGCYLLYLNTKDTIFITYLLFLWVQGDKVSCTTVAKTGLELLILMFSYCWITGAYAHIWLSQLLLKGRIPVKPLECRVHYL